MNTLQSIQISDVATKTIALVKKTVQSSPTGVSFFSVKNYTNKSGEVSNQLINVGIKYANMKAKDIQFLTNLDVTTLTDAKSSKVDLEIAKAELIASFLIPDATRSEAQINAYTIIADGIKVHNETGLLYVYGYKVSKTVLVKGEYKTVNSSTKTIAKNELRKLLKTGNFVNFSLEVGNTLTAKGETIEL